MPSSVGFEDMPPEELNAYVAGVVSAREKAESELQAAQTTIKDLQTEIDRWKESVAKYAESEACSHANEIKHEIEADEQRMRAEDAEQKLAEMKLDLAKRDEARSSQQNAPSENERRLGAALQKINVIRNDLVGAVSEKWAENVYALVTALDDAGVKGIDPGATNTEVAALIKQLKKRDEVKDRLYGVIAERNAVVDDLTKMMASVEADRTSVYTELRSVERQRDDARKRCDELDKQIGILLKHSSQDASGKYTDSTFHRAKLGEWMQERFAALWNSNDADREKKFFQATATVLGLC